MRTKSRWMKLATGIIPLLFISLPSSPATWGDEVVSLPDGVQAVWDLKTAYRETTASRDRVCINGLWRWQPASLDQNETPTENWGYFKVPGCWPGITDYMQKDCQTVFAHPTWSDRRLGSDSAAWYQRQITVPADWNGRRIVLEAQYVNSYASVFIDGHPVGEIRYPGGELDLTGVCEGGRTHWLTLHVVAMPLEAVMMSYSDTASARKIQGRVARRGLCGDVFLASTPRGPRIGDLKLATSVRDWQLLCDVALFNLADGQSYLLQATITDKGNPVRTFTSGPFDVDKLQDGRIKTAHAWRPERLWDIHTPGNKYQIQLTLLEAGGKALDSTSTVDFGFREFWIDGRDFFLNGTRVYLSSVPLDNAQVGAAWANYDAARESMERLQSFGINFVYTHNYGCEPGSHLSFAEILRAADDVGMLVALSQPHFGHYKWDRPDADRTNGYARHAAFYAGVAQTHASVVAYAMSHNATGYAEDMNPDMIDGIQAQRSEWSTKNVQQAGRAEQIVRSIDAHRIIYHHASGNLGSMHTSNFYANFAPIQEMSDWFEHWATAGTKPLFTCEYSVPMPWDWTMYRGWYKGNREFGSARVPWEFCLAEWNSQFLGDRAYQMSDQELANLRWEARQFQTGQLWHRWDYPHAVGSSDFEQRHAVYAMYFRQNWPAFRAWGMSANSPWNHGHYWTLRDGVNKQRKSLPVDWRNLQQPGSSPDYVEDRYERIDLAFERSDWIPTVAAQALISCNGPLLAYLAGKPAAFTSQDHNFHPGEAVEKQLIVINNSRKTVHCDCSWSLGLPRAQSGNRKFSLATGQQHRIPLRFQLPAQLAPESYQLKAEVQFAYENPAAAAVLPHRSPNQASLLPGADVADVMEKDNAPSATRVAATQQDSLPICVLPLPSASRTTGTVALFDPQGETAQLLTTMGVDFELIDAGADISNFGMLIVGKQALTVSGAGPEISSVRKGLKVLVFEQTPEVLEQRLGFRVATYGLRKVFVRVPDHPVLDGLKETHLKDWRGDSTIIPPRLDYKLAPEFSYTPTVRWCGIPVPRLWRCGNRGNVASALIEKPHRGDFLPIVEGGYSLQYSPLIEYREGNGMVLFCQMDVTGRTEHDPAAQKLAQNAINYVATWRPSAGRKVVYAGNDQLRKHLESSGISVTPFPAGPLLYDDLLVVGPGGSIELASRAEAIAAWRQRGGQMILLGLDAEQATPLLQDHVATERREHIATYFEPFSLSTPLVGIGPADVHVAAPRTLPLLSGVNAVGNGVLGINRDDHIVFCQLTPDQFSYEPGQRNLKRTFRRISFLISRLLANHGARGSTPILARFSSPVGEGAELTLTRNGQFESDGLDQEAADQWLFSSGSKRATCERRKTGGDAGGWSLRLFCPPPEGDGKAGAMLAQHDIRIESGQWYRISLRARAEQWAAGSASVTITNMRNWRSLFPYQRFDPEPSWRTFEFEVQANDTATEKTRFQIWFDGSGMLDLANVSVRAIDDPATGRWLEGLYLDVPEEWDDPYRFFRW